MQHSPAGEARGVLRFPFDEARLAAYLTGLQSALLRAGSGRSRQPSPQEQAVQEFGQRLFETLLPDEIRSLYYESRREALRRGMGLRLRLRILAPELAALPWEYLYDQRQADYLCLSRQTPLVRYVEVSQPIEPLTIVPPLRILAMMCSPSDQDPLDVAREQERVRQALQGLERERLVEITWLEGQTWRHLHREMHRGPWHVFHFIGHGGFDPRKNEGLLALAEDNGKTHLLSATELGRLLANHPSLRLVVLNACEGAKGSQRDLFSSTAATLARRGLPAVLAMQEEITDKAAIECTRAFYEALADGLPVDAAVAEARTAISLGIENTMEWGTPVLYMRSPDGVLFDLPQDRRRSSIIGILPTPAPETNKAAPPQPEAQRPPKQVQMSAQHDPNATQVPGALQFPNTQELAEQWMAEANSHFQARQFAQAVALYERVLQLDDSNARAAMRLGRALTELRRPAEAVAAFDRALKLEPDDERLYFLKASVLKELGNYTAALATYEQAIARYPGDDVAHNDKGLILSALNRHQEALASFEQAVRLNVNFAVAHNNKGDALRSLLRYQDALAAYDQAIKLDHTKALFCNNRGCVLLDLQRNQDALAAFDQAIKLDRDYAIAHRNRGEVLDELGRPEEALSEYEWAIELDPQDTYALHCKGAVQRELGRVQGALATYEQLLKLDPQDGLAHTTRGAVLEELKRYPEALQAYEQAIALNPRDGFAWRNKGNVLKRLGRGAEAEEAFQEATRFGA
ncbi:MAG TPA: tetratricopeptide repeat protein [Ktedonobacterales bacterium]